MAHVTDLQKDISRGEETDTIISPYVFYAWVVGWIVMVALAQVASSAVSLLALLLLVAMGWLIWSLCSRRTAHLSRMADLAEHALAYLRQQSNASGNDASRFLPELHRVGSQMRDHSTERSATGWVFLLSPLMLLSVFGTVNIIAVAFVASFLSSLASDLATHGRQESELAAVLRDAFAAVGGSGDLTFDPRITERKTGRYIVLTLVTLGFFGLYWWYQAIQDDNDHFLAHDEWEDRLAQALD